MELYAILGLIAAIEWVYFTTGSLHNQNGESKKSKKKGIFNYFYF
jgi:hypothetical protein